MTETSEVVKMFVLGLSAGVLSGLFGIGGGLVIVPVLVLIFGFDTKTAVGTSLFVILLPTGLLGVWEYWKNGEMRIAAALWIALGVFFGAYFGQVGRKSVGDRDETALCPVLTSRRDLLPRGTPGGIQEPAPQSRRTRGNAGRTAHSGCPLTV